MPVLKKIVVRDFRNIALQELDFSPNVNCIYGNNGVGKTNLMDAIYYLSMTKSAFNSSDKVNFRYGQESFAIAGTYAMPGGLDVRFSVQVENGGEKKVRRDEKVYQKVSDHIGVLPVVMVSPSDSALVSESGEERRRFVNAILSQLDREYLDAVSQYNRILAQRNRYLKGNYIDEMLLDAFDERLSALSEPVFRARAALAEDLERAVGVYYSRISGGRETVAIAYHSDLQKAPLAQLLRESRERDRFLHYTTCGLQRDDFIFSMNGYPIRKYGSQGQQKSFLVALKFSQYDLMNERYGYAPILLLDDLLDKLDLDRIANLLAIVAGNDFGQIFLSDCNKNRLSALVDRITSERCYFEAEGGAFRPTDG